MNTEPRGSFTREQTEQLLRPINPNRVVTGSHVKPHLTQQDVMAHLIRVFGFGHFDVEVLSSDCIFEEATTNKNNKPAWSVGYRALVRLHVRDEQQRLVAYYDGGSTGESEGQPSRAASHDLAYKSALSTAMKRAAIALGDQFGLSLYNKGQMGALVKGTMIGLNYDGADMQNDVEQQHVDGGREGETVEAPEEEAKPARRKPTNGRQGTKRKAPEGQSDLAPEDQHDNGTPDEPTPVIAGEPIETGPMQGIVPTEAQVQAAQVIRDLQEQGTDTTVAEAIMDEPIPDEGRAAVLADDTTGEVIEDAELEDEDGAFADEHPNPDTSLAESDWEALLRAAESVEALQDVWNRMVNAGARTSKLTAVTTARKNVLSA